MCNRNWQDALSKTLYQEKPVHEVRIAILGLGNDTRGDDAAGVIISRRLQSVIKENPTRMIIEAGVAPENVTGSLRKFAPDSVLLIGAAHLGAQPGEIRVLSVDEITGISAFTHTLPPSILAKFLEQDLGCKVTFLGIQPESMEPDMPLSPGVRSAIAEVVQGLATILA